MAISEVSFDSGCVLTCKDPSASHCSSAGASPESNNDLTLWSWGALSVSGGQCIKIQDHSRRHRENLNALWGNMRASLAGWSRDGERGLMKHVISVVGNSSFAHIASAPAVLQVFSGSQFAMLQIWILQVWLLFSTHLCCRHLFPLTPHPVTSSCLSHFLLSLHLLFDFFPSPVLLAGRWWLIAGVAHGDSSSKLTGHPSDLPVATATDLRLHRVMWWWAACWSAERQIAVSVARLKSHKEMWREVFPFGLSPQQQQLFNCWWALSNLYVFDQHQLLNIDRYFKAIKVWNQQMDLRLFRLRSVTRTNSSINHRGCYQLDNLAMSYQLSYDVFIWKRQNL